jgi:membrane dipeptidase
MLIIDAKAIPAWNRSVFEDMQAGGLSAVSVVCSIWEDFEASVRSMVQLKTFINENSDILYLVRTGPDLRRGLSEGKTGIILSWQNSTGFNDYLPFIEVFSELGLRIAQVAFMTANSAGSGCYESVDRGLSDFGREMVPKLNQCGIAIDIAHLKEETARDVIHASTKPVFYSQSSPRALKENVRNKTDEDMKLVADRGGIIAIAALPHYLPAGLESTVDDMAAAIAYAMNVAGEEAVAIGTDLTPSQPKSFYDYVSHDKGNGRRLIDYSTVPVLPGLQTFRDYPNIIKALERIRIPSSKIERVMGLNLDRYLTGVWSA